MHTFFSIKQGETRPRTFILPPKLRTAGITIDTCTVTAITYKGTDPLPVNILNGSPVILATDDTIDGIAVAARQAVTQKINGGVPGVIYILTYALDLDDSTTYTEDVLQPCSTYVPP